VPSGTSFALRDAMTTRTSSANIWTTRLTMQSQYYQDTPDYTVRSLPLLVPRCLCKQTYTPPGLRHQPQHHGKQCSRRRAGRRAQEACRSSEHAQEHIRQEARSLRRVKGTCSNRRIMCRVASLTCDCAIGRRYHPPLSIPPRPHRSVPPFHRHEPKPAHQGDSRRDRPPGC
jgi:hypothetical protein